MARLFFLLCMVLIVASVNAQNLFVFKSTVKGTITPMSPEWLNTNSMILRSNVVQKDSVYYYDTKENNPDSALIMTQYFDSLGNLLERDEFSVKKKGEVWKVSNFSYLGDQLFKKEIISMTENKEVHEARLKKDVFTYEYDSAGDVVKVKAYSFPNSSIYTYSLTIQENEYDSSGHLIKEFLTRGRGNRFLYRTYIYDHGILTELNTYDSTGYLSYSNTRKFDNKKNILSIYLGDNAPDNLRLELYYDDKKRLAQQKIYWEGGVDYESQYYWYNAGGLVDRQVVKYDINGKKYYYRHFYSR